MMRSSLPQPRLFAALIAVVLLAACTSRGGASFASQPSEAAGIDTSSATPPQQERLGLRGSLAWLVGTDGLSFSGDSGRTFAPVPLPSQVSPSAVLAIAAVPGTIWLASSGPGRSTTVYARGDRSGAWSAGATLTPTWPSGLGGADAEPPSAVWITPGGPDQVVVLTELGLSHSVSIPRLFVSGDGGVTFTERLQPATSDLNAPWDAMAMSGDVGVAVIGERSDTVVYSADAGASWAPSTLRDAPAGTEPAVGSPLFAGSSIYLPVVDAGTGAFILLRSTDGGHVFGSVGAESLPPGTFVGAAAPPVAAAGDAFWLVSPTSGSVYRSMDDGQTWAAAEAQLPMDVSAIAATDAQSASVVIENNVCAIDKTNCSTSEFSEFTANGGQSWVRP